MFIVPPKVYQRSEIKIVSEYLRSEASKGSVASAFVYGGEVNESGDAWGHLYVLMPGTIGFTLRGHDAIKDQFHISDFRQKEQIVLWIKDTVIDDALKVVSNALASEKQR